MKLLLTSAGVNKRSIAAALDELVGRPKSEVKVGFIPTAANAEEGNKDWLISQFLNLWRNGYTWIDVVDFSADGVDWQTRLADADVLYLSGGNTFHLLDQARKTGFADWLRKNLDRKVYVGGSASTILVTPSIEVAAMEPGDPNLPGLTDLTGLGLVDFEVEPHCDMMRFDIVEKYAAGRPNPVYAIDDQTAIKVVDDRVEVVSEGFWKLFKA